MSTAWQTRSACDHPEINPDPPRPAWFAPSVHLTRSHRVRTLLTAISWLADRTRRRCKNPWRAARRYGIRMPAHADAAEVIRQSSAVACTLKDAEARFRSLPSDHRSTREVARRTREVWTLLAEICAAAAQGEHRREATPDAPLADDTRGHDDDTRCPVTGRT